MTAYQVSDIFVRLKQQGFEQLDKIKTSFRELGKVTGLTDKDIAHLRTELLAYARESGNTETVNNGLIDTFKGLRAQATLCSSTYTQLTRDIDRFTEIQRGATNAVIAQRESILRSASAGTRNAQALTNQLTALQALIAQTRPGSSAFAQLTKDIETARAVLDRFNSEAVKSTGTIRQLVNRAVPTSEAKVADRLRDLRAGMKEQQDIIDAFDRLPAKDPLRKRAEELNKVAEAQRLVNEALRQEALIVYGERVRSGRRAVRASAEAFALPLATDPTQGFGVEGLNRRFGDLPNTTAGLNQNLSELSERLASTTRGTVDYLAVAMRMAAVQRELGQVTQGYAQSLVMGLRTNTVSNSAKNIQEAISALRAEMQELDTTTTEGARHYAENANSVIRLEKQLTKLESTYRHVSDAASAASAAMRAVGTPAQEAAIGRTRDTYLNYNLVRQRDAAYAELSTRITQAAAATPLLLPAAGQTTAPGTGRAYSGANVRPGLPSPNIEQFFPVRPLPGVAATPINERARASYISETAAVRENAEAKQRAAAATELLRQKTQDIARSNTASIATIRDVRQEWAQFRDTVDTLSPVFREAQQQLTALDRRLERVEGRRRPTAGQITQIAGAAISGGIFGGPEGFVGGVAGGLIGGVGGSFAGAAIGAQVGAVRQQIGQMADYAAQIRQTRTALQGIVSSFGDYQTAIETVNSASERMNIPVLEGAKQFTKLSAAVVGSGRSIQDARLAYDAVTASVIATTGSVEGVDAALTAVSQVFSKGKATAEEIRGQLGERLPGALALFAASLGKTPRELDKAFDEGKVSTDDFMKFLAYAYKRYAKDAEVLAQSTEQAGERMARQWERTAKRIGDAFGPTGAAIQDFATRALQRLNAVVERFIQTGAIKPGAGYYVSQVEEKRLSFDALRRMRDAASPRVQQEYEARRQLLGSGGFVGPMTAEEQRAAAYRSRAAAPVDAARYNVLNEAIIKLEAIQRRTNSEKQTPAKPTQTPADEQATKEREKRGKELLDAIEARDKAIYDARKQREEQLSDIRLRAIEDAKKLEQQFADSRLQIERSIAATRQKMTDRAEDVALRIRQAQGEDSVSIDIRRKALELNRSIRDERLTLEQQIADDERNQQRTIAEYQKGVADAINKTNVAYARRIGEIQQDYAIRSANVIKKGTAEAAKRLAVAGELVSARMEAQNYTSATSTLMLDVSAGRTTLPFKEALHQIKDYNTARHAAIARVAALESRVGAPMAPTLPPSIPPSTTAPVSPSTIPQIGGGRLLTQVRREQLATSNMEFDQRLVSEVLPRFLDVVSTSEEKNRQLLQEQATNARVAELANMNIADDLAKQLEEHERIRQKQLDRLEVAREESINSAKLIKDAQLRNETLAYTDTLYKKSVDGVAEHYITNTKITLELAKQNDLLRTRQNMDVRGGFYEGTRKYVESIGTLRDATTQLTTTSLKGLEEQFVTLASTGAASFRELANSVVRDTLRMIMQQFVFRTLLAPLNNLGNPITSLLAQLPGSTAAATGMQGFNTSMPALAPTLQGIPTFLAGATMANGIQPFAMGGVVSRPTIFQYANGGVPGTGLMGEAGPEAILPLRRGRDGKLGVGATGGGSINVTVNVTAEAAAPAQGGTDQAAQLGQVVASAVQAELVRQKRPGGLLS